MTRKMLRESAEMAKILVIDDDALIRRMINGMLTAAGHRVFEAENGIEGMKRFHAESPAVVITDILMPEQEGIATIRQIRAAGLGTAVIAISGGGQEAGSNFLKMAGQLGADAILPKPFRADELLALVNQVLKTDPTVGN